MTRLILVAAFVGIFVQPARAHARPCNDLDQNSCWSVVNAFSEPLSLTCDFRSEQGDRWYGAIEDVWVGPGETFSHQFSRGWADGLGYGSYGASGVCIFRAGGRERRVEVEPTGPGARVQARLSRRGRASVVVQEYWGDEEISVYRESRR